MVESNSTSSMCSLLKIHPKSTKRNLVVLFWSIFVNTWYNRSTMLGSLLITLNLYWVMQLQSVYVSTFWFAPLFWHCNHPSGFRVLFATSEFYRRLIYLCDSFDPSVNENFVEVRKVCGFLFFLVVLVFLSFSAFFFLFES